MSVILKEIELAGSKGRAKVEALFDSGATYSCITRELAEQLGGIVPLPEPLELETAEKGENLTVTERISLDFHLNGYRFTSEFMIVPKLSERAIIGAHTMQAWRFKLDFEIDEVIIDPKVTKLRLMYLQEIKTLEVIWEKGKGKITLNEISGRKRLGYMFGNSGYGGQNLEELVKKAREDRERGQFLLDNLEEIRDALSARRQCDEKNNKI